MSPAMRTLRLAADNGLVTRLRDEAARRRVPVNRLVLEAARRIVEQPLPALVTGGRRWTMVSVPASLAAAILAHGSLERAVAIAAQAVLRDLRRGRVLLVAPRARGGVVNAKLGLGVEDLRRLRLAALATGGTLSGVVVARLLVGQQSGQDGGAEVPERGDSGHPQAANQAERR